MTAYTFPRITHINQVLSAIEGRDEFVVKVDEEHGYTVINYLVNFEDTFPPVVDERTAILRECRGITFDTATGKVLSRKYHKFFNLGERPETQISAVDWDSPYRRFKKLDGSMITPLLIDGSVRFCTKMGLTGVAAPVDTWAADKVEYHEFCKYWMSQGWTPIFEWCSRIQRIVIDYPVTSLILTALRENESGEYMNAPMLKEEAEAYGIPVCSFSYELEGFDEEVIEEIRALEGEEGDVFRWADGTMLKLKGEWYSQLHKTLEHLTLEKDVIRLIIENKLDDAKPFLPEDLIEKTETFGKIIFESLKKLASDLYWEVQADFDNFNGSKKKFAEKNLQGSDKITNGVKFWMWDHLEEGEASLYEYLVNLVGNSLSSQGKVDNIRHLWGGQSWYALRDAKDTE
jgi:RNA ligase